MIASLRRFTESGSGFEKDTARKQRKRHLGLHKAHLSGDSSALIDCSRDFCGAKIIALHWEVDEVFYFHLRGGDMSFKHCCVQIFFDKQDFLKF
jgi:hypothetical protein